MSKIDFSNPTYNCDNELNLKINKRNKELRYYPSNNLQPNFDPRPLSTKYSLLKYPLENKHVDNNSTSLMKYDRYDNNKIFYPGNSKAPISHFFDNIDIDSVLKNQHRRLTTNDGPNYIPNIKSDLFLENKYQDNSQSNLYKLPYKIRGTHNNKCNIAPNTFFNHTRYNIKNL